jgi:FixJ family two-component response regulator
MGIDGKINKDDCRIFVIDDDLSVCRGLSRLLHSCGYVTEIYTSAADYLQREHFKGIACIILDVHMPQLNGMDLQQKLIAQNNTLPIIFLTAHGDVPMAVDAMKQGADDFLTKPVDEKILLDAVERALLRHRSVRSKQLIAGKTQARLDTLTPREREVLQCILGGATNKQIADDLGISEKTVKIHRGKVMQKLNVSSAAELGWVSSFSSISANKKHKAK